MQRDRPDEDEAASGYDSNGSQTSEDAGMFRTTDQHGMAGLGPLGGTPGRGDTADAAAERQRRGAVAPSSSDVTGRRLGVRTPNDNSTGRDGPGVSGTATTDDTAGAPNTPGASDEDRDMPNYGTSGQSGLGGAGPVDPREAERGQLDEFPRGGEATPGDAGGPALRGEDHGPVDAPSEDEPSPGTMGRPAIGRTGRMPRKDADGYYGAAGGLGGGEAMGTTTQRTTAGMPDNPNNVPQPEFANPSNASSDLNQPTDNPLVEGVTGSIEQISTAPDAPDAPVTPPGNDVERTGRTIADDYMRHMEETDQGIGAPETP